MTLFSRHRIWLLPLALSLAAQAAAAQPTGSLGTVTQGEVDDITRGLLMPEAQSPPAARLPDEDLALRGDANAMFRLAGRYERGDGVERNDAIALSWYGRAAEEGVYEAVPKIGELRDKLAREDSRMPRLSDEPPAATAAPTRRQQAARPPQAAEPAPVPAPPVTAAPMPAPAPPPNQAAPNDPEQELKLAAAARDDTEALRHYRAAAELGSAEGAFNLAYRLANGRGGPQNDAEAALWYQAAAQQGSAAAQNNLGFMYASGRGVARSDETAIEWYRRAAEQDYPPAQTNLGMMYDAGRGVPPNPADALAWYSKAAAAGYGPARSRLADMYANGRGVPRDERMADFWRRSAETANSKP